MKKRILFSIFVLAMLLTGMIAYADVPVIETDVSSPANDCIMLGLNGEYVSDPGAAVAMINEIRWEACEEGVLDPSDPNKTRKLTTADYQGIKWSDDLEYIARIRAAEAAMTMAHTRTNGRSIWGLHSPAGVSSSGEVLAWNGSSGMQKGIHQWYEEKADWVNQNQNAETGHYEAMIDPRNRYVGLGAFCSEDTEFYNCTAGEFSKRSDLSENSMTFTGECVQKLEVLKDHLGSGGEISGILGGEKGDTSQLTLKTTAIFSDGLYTHTSGLQILDPVTWSSAAPDIASVDSNGKATSNYCGTAMISASAGNISATAEFRVLHKEEAIPAVAATCTATGLTQGRKCTVCGKILQAQTTVPASGHFWKAWTVTREATYDAEGEEQRVCSKDASHIEKRSIAKKEKPAEPADTALTPGTEVKEAAAPTAKAQEKKILALKSDSDPKGSTYGLLQAQMKKAKKTSITLKWKSVKGAKSYIVYGNKCGKKFKKLKSVKGTSFKQKKLKKGTYYKYVVVAVKNGKAIATSKTVFAATTGGKAKNPKTVKTKKTLTVAVGKTSKISAAINPDGKKTKNKRAIAFESSNTNIATVSKKGVVKGIRGGTCYVYAYAQNGIMAKVKVIVG